MKALLVLNLQNDFSAFGNMPIPGTDELVPLANRLQLYFDVAIAVQICYPASHKSFAANHLFRQPGKTMMINGKEQLLAAIHCVQDSFGANFINGLAIGGIHKTFSVGTDAAANIYSAFADEALQHPSGLSEILKDKAIKSVYIMGVNVGDMLLNTASTAIDLGFETFLIKDVCSGLDISPDFFENLNLKGLQLIESKTIENNWGNGQKVGYF
jgi:nicotinamidase/pyrazinamidase